MKSLSDIYSEHQEKVSDKWSIYITEYDRLFSVFRKSQIRLLEIGVQNGGSLEIWSKYFPNAQLFVGCDINTDCAKLVYDDPRIQLVIGDANTDVVEKKILGHSTNFDLVLDDGSHTSSDIAKSFARYFPHLNQGGIFIAEDLHCSYWTEFEGGLYYPFSSMAFFKLLADVINHEHWGLANERIQLLQGFSAKFSIEFDEKSLADIHSIEFFNSACVVRKLNATSNVVGKRVIAGKHELIKAGHSVLASISQTPSQAGNSWSTMIQAPEKAWQKLTGDLLEQVNQVNSLKQAVHDKEVHIGNLNLEISKREEIISEIYASSSWRVTQPIRFVGHQVKRVIRVTELVLLAIVLGGGFKNTFKKVTRLYRREGIVGIRRGFKFVARFSQITHTTDSLVIGRNDYKEWVRRYDTLTDNARVVKSSRINEFKNRPLISVVMPTYNTPIKWLTEAIESVRNQIYANWELCIADDASTDRSVRILLESYTKLDKRIKVVYREKNGHISAASNSAIALVTGQWVALLDHDDLLTENALFWVVDAINQNPEAGLIYSDEDKLDLKGNRFDPYFKCEFNPELLLAQNMICHLSVYRSDLLKSLNGFRTGFDGAQDYDLVLRVVEKLLPTQIIHIPRILYHWRAIPGSTALDADEKNYAAVAGRLAVTEHLKRRGLSALVTPAPESTNHNRVRFVLPNPLPLVSVIIPTRDNVDFLSMCINSILQLTTYPNYEIIIIDNGSLEAATSDFFDTLPTDRVKVVRDDSPFNFSALNNRAAKVASGDFLCLMNNDIEIITPDWLEEMVSFAVQPEIGCVGARLWYPDGRLQHGGIIVGLGGVAGHSHKYAQKGEYGYFRRLLLHQSFSAVTAACMVVKRTVYEYVDGLDENLAVAFNDVDFCLRVKDAGYRNVWTPYAEMIHHESVSRGNDDTQEKKARFESEVKKMKERWGTGLLDDFAYSPNLTLNHEDFSIAWPPRVELL